MAKEVARINSSGRIKSYGKRTCGDAEQHDIHDAHPFCGHVSVGGKLVDLLGGEAGGGGGDRGCGRRCGGHVARAVEKNLNIRRNSSTREGGSVGARRNKVDGEKRAQTRSNEKKSK